MITIDLKNLDNLAKSLRCRAEKLRQAQETVVNEVAGQVKTDWAKLINQELNLPLNTIEQAIIAQANGNELNISVDNSRLPFYSRASTPLTEFNPTQNSVGTSVMIKKNKGVKNIKSAFVARMKSGKVGVFLRVDRPRLPIKQLYTSSVAHVASNHIEAMQREATERVVKAISIRLKSKC